MNKIKLVFFGIGLLTITLVGTYLSLRNYAEQSRQKDIRYSQISDMNLYQFSETMATEGSGMKMVINGFGEKQKTGQNRIAVTGVAGASAEIWINEITTQADNLGRFKAEINLQPGINKILVFANDEYGNFAEKEFEVDYEP